MRSPKNPAWSIARNGCKASSPIFLSSSFQRAVHLRPLVQARRAKAATPAGSFGSAMLYDQRQKLAPTPMPENSRPTLFRSKHAEMITARKFFLLFTFLLVALILYPFAGDSGSRYYLFRILSSLVIVLSVYAVSFRRSLVLFALVLAVPALLQHVFFYRFDAGILPILRVAMSFTFEVFIVVVIFRRVFTHQQANAETIFGALCVYLLVGFSFTSLYGILSDVRPDA